LISSSKYFIIEVSLTREVPNNIKKEEKSVRMFLSLPKPKTKNESYLTYRKHIFPLLSSTAHLVERELIRREDRCLLLGIVKGDPFSFSFSFFM
jgi:hypothetical protein